MRCSATASPITTGSASAEQTTSRPGGGAGVGRDLFGHGGDAHGFGLGPSAHVTGKRVGKQRVRPRYRGIDALEGRGALGVCEVVTA